jgi:hypothetical protein
VTRVLEIDHVVLGVPDLDEAADELRRRHGLTSLAGGQHPSWGTENRIVALGAAYLELVAVADPQIAAGNVFGRWVTSMASGGPVFGWAVRTDDLDAVATRLGVTAVDGSRVDAAGRTLRWRLVGVEAAAAEPGLPFFIQWGDATPHPGRAPVRHPAGQVSLAGLVVGAEDGPRLRRWLGGELERVETQPGPAEVHRVVLSSEQGLTSLEAGDWVRGDR